MRTAKDRKAKRLARLAQERQQAVEKALFRATVTTNAKDHIISGARQRKIERDEKIMEKERQRQAERLDRLTLEEEVQHQKALLAAEAARIGAERLRQAMICCGQNDPFSSDPGETAHCPYLSSSAYTRLSPCFAKIFCAYRRGREICQGCAHWSCHPLRGWHHARGVLSRRSTGRHFNKELQHRNG